MLSIADEFPLLLHQLQPADGYPAIAAMHIAPVELKPGTSCKFAAMQLADGTIGITYVALGDTFQQLQHHRHELDELIGQSPMHAVEWYGQSSDWQRAIGMAAINAISQTIFHAKPQLLTAAGSTADTLPFDQREHIGMVGYFPSLVKDFRTSGIRLTVIELDKSLVQQDRNFRVTSETAALADCDTVICTGTTLINHTIDNILDHCGNASQIHLLGPTTGCLPDPLFARGVTTIGGRRVVDPVRFLKHWQEQTNWNDCTQRYQITRDGYPGVANIVD